MFKAAGQRSSCCRKGLAETDVERSRCPIRNRSFVRETRWRRAISRFCAGCPWPPNWDPPGHLETRSRRAVLRPPHGEAKTAGTRGRRCGDAANAAARACLGRAGAPARVVARAARTSTRRWSSRRGSLCPPRTKVSAYRADDGRVSVCQHHSSFASPFNVGVGVSWCESDPAVRTARPTPFVQASVGMWLGTRDVKEKNQHETSRAAHVETAA